MRIRTRILSTSVLLAVFALTVALLIFQGANRIYRFTNAVERRGEIVRAMYELNGFMNDYLLRREARPYEQWLLKNEEVSRLLLAEQIADEQNRVDLSAVITEHDRLTRDFARLVALDWDVMSASEDVQDVLTANISLRSDTMIETLSSLSRMDLEKRAQLRERADTFIYLLIALFTVIACAVLYYLYVSILNPLFELELGTQRIGAGNLSYRVGTKAQDEIGELSRSFDAMTDRVRTAYTNLEQKVEERTRDLEKFRRAVEDATDGVIMTDKRGNIAYVNKRWQAVNGYTLKEVMGKRPSLLRSGKTPQAVEGKMQEAIKQGKPFRSEDIINRRKDGTEYQAEVQIFPIMINGKAEFFVGILQDISERKAVERMKNEFISLATHQLRTPVSAIRWFTEILLEDKKAKLSPTARDIITNIGEINGRMNKLVAALLNISRIESGRLTIAPVPTRLNELVQQSLNELERDIQEKNLHITVDIPADIPELSIDQNLVREVYRSLFTNAVKYTPKNGAVRVVLEKQKDSVVSTVIDNGIGIPKDEQWRVFQKFFRAPNAIELDEDGTGLGLYLAKLVVEASGGKIWFSSEEHRGSVFAFTLPLKGSPSQKGEVSLGK